MKLLLFVPTSLFYDMIKIFKELSLFEYIVDTSSLDNRDSNHINSISPCFFLFPEILLLVIFYFINIYHFL